MAAIWLHFFYCFLLIFTTHEFHNSLKNKRQTEFYFYLALCFADWTGLEPATPCVTGMYSNQLNYQSIHCFSSKATQRYRYFLILKILWPKLFIFLIFDFYNTFCETMVKFARRWILKRIGTLRSLESSDFAACDG